MPGVLSLTLAPGGCLERAEVILDGLGDLAPARGDLRGHWIRMVPDRRAALVEYPELLDRLPGADDWREHLRLDVP